VVIGLGGRKIGGFVGIANRPPFFDPLLLPAQALFGRMDWVFGGFAAVKDYYEVMGLPREATGEEIKKVYRSLALQYHPDRNQGDPVCENRLKEVNEAYQVLGDEEKRRHYDLSCSQSSSRHMFDQEDVNGDPDKLSRVFAHWGVGMRGPGGCKGMGFGKRGCRRWMRNP
jgi:curved DNA-binding protein CbpA